MALSARWIKRVGYISEIQVPPTGPDNAEIYIIGDFPDEASEALIRPFVGNVGDILWGTLSMEGISRESVKITNLCNYRPASNNFHFLIDSYELRDGLKCIKQEIETNKNIKLILLLGEKPLHYLLGKNGINKWHGSPIRKDNIIYLPTFHPSYIARVGNDYPIFANDIKKINRLLQEGIKEDKFNTLIDPRGMGLIEACDEINSWEDVAVDIESVMDSTHILCIGFGNNNRSICVVNHSIDSGDFEFTQAITKLLSSPVKKIFQGGIFDTLMLEENGYITENYYWDTLIGAHVLDPELPLSLAHLTAMNTDMPYFKDMGKSAIPDNEKAWSKAVKKSLLYEYNCLDTLACYKVYEKQFKEINEDEDYLRIFNYEMSMLPMLRHLAQSGMLIDQERRAEIRAYLVRKIKDDQLIVNSIFQKDVNVQSVKFMDLIYGEMGLPIKKKKTGQATLDEDAIISLVGMVKSKLNEATTEAKQFEWMKKLGALTMTLSIRGNRKLLSSYIDPTISIDNRIRSTYHIGPETGRLSCSKYVDGSGNNGQTWPRKVLDYEKTETK